MKVNNDDKITITKEGKKINEKVIEKNEKDSKKKALILYIIPLAIIVVIGIIYIFTQFNILLILFGICMFVVLFGGDCSSRTCPKCKKWNSVSWIKAERRIKRFNVTKKNFFKKEISKEIKQKYLLAGGKCKNCDCEFETQKNRLL